MQRPYLALFFITVILAVALSGKVVLAALLGLPAAVTVARLSNTPFQEDT